MSLFITFEGGEGCGKSTQSRILYRRLTGLVVPVLLTHEPGVTPLGRKITRLLKWAKNVPVSPAAELFLFNASRAQLAAEVIKPWLARGAVVICDRFADSTTAYQGYGRGLDLNMVASVNLIGAQGLVPDLTILLDISVEKGLSRIKEKKPDRFEMEDLAFHRRVRAGFLTMAGAEPGRWLVIDGARDKKEISGIIWDKVSRLLHK